MDMQAYLLSLQIIQTSSCIVSHPSPSLFPFPLNLTAWDYISYADPHVLKYGVDYESSRLWKVRKVDCLSDP